jgi:type I restriction enzyme R subunit
MIAAASLASKTASTPQRLKMVMTRGKDDEKALYDLLGNKDERKKFDTQFKKAESNFKIAIVVDMWLTGFDVPFLDTIYIDKPVQRHNLIQTISRVNRKFENRCNVRQVPARIQLEKGLGISALRAAEREDAALFPDSCVPPRSLSSLNSTRRALDSGKITRGLRPATSRTMHAKKGLVVDYIGIKKQMNLALAHYSKADSSNIEEIEASIVVVRDHLDLLGRIFHQFDTKPYFSGSPVEQLECLNKAAEFVQLTDKIEKRVMFLVKRLKAAYDICSGTDVFSQSERDQIHFYLAVRSIVAKLTKGEAPDSAQMNAKVRTMIAEALQADGVEEIFKLGDDQATEIDIFADDYMARIEKIKLPNTKIKLLQQLLKKAIEDFKKVNKTKGVDFSEQFQSLVSKYNERDEKDSWTTEGVKDLTDEFFTMVENLKTEMGSFNDLGIDLEEKFFYDILKKLAQKYEFDYPEDKLIKLAKEVKTVVDDKAQYPDWDKKDSIKAELKVGLILLLAEHGYPPVDRDEVYKEIFEQAESFKKHKMQGS